MSFDERAEPIGLALFYMRYEKNKVLDFMNGQRELPY
jgi:hypothetical protein